MIVITWMWKTRISKCRWITIQMIDTNVFNICDANIIWHSAVLAGVRVASPALHYDLISMFLFCFLFFFSLFFINYWSPKKTTGNDKQNEAHSRELHQVSKRLDKYRLTADWPMNKPIWSPTNIFDSIQRYSRHQEFRRLQLLHYYTSTTATLSLSLSFMSMWKLVRVHINSNCIWHKRDITASILAVDSTIRNFKLICHIRIEWVSTTCVSQFMLYDRSSERRFGDWRCGLDITRAAMCQRFNQCPLSSTIYHFSQFESWRRRQL